MSRRSAFIAVIGAPNAGKSTLVNRLVGAKVSIVTRKVQTTRARIRGVAIEGDAQLVFIDTPGIFAPRRRLDRSMVAAAWEGIEDVDFILLVVDAQSMLAGPSKSTEDTDRILDELKRRGAKAILVLNKIDRLARPKLLKLIAELSVHDVFENTFLVSAENGDGVADLKGYIVGKAPAGEWMYPEDQLSDISDRLMAAEVTREKVFTRLHQELPYQSTVETTAWTRTGKGELRIEQTIFVSRESHRPIVLGKGGQTLKAIGEASRKELSEIFGEPVHLFLNVTVREGWADEAARYREMGLDIVD
ncbi:MAG: GTPase Era [Parvularculaceae bacterium]|nr:GTPase Era [Parvularculaceae bacterium]